MKKKKVRYELRHFVDNNISFMDEGFTNKEEAIKEARYRSGQEEGRIYFVKMVTEQVVFFVGEHG